MQQPRYFKIRGMTPAPYNTETKSLIKMHEWQKYLEDALKTETKIQNLSEGHRFAIDLIFIFTEKMLNV